LHCIANLTSHQSSRKRFRRWILGRCNIQCNVKFTTYQRWLQTHATQWKCTMFFNRKDIVNWNLYQELEIYSGELKRQHWLPPVGLIILITSAYTHIQLLWTLIQLNCIYTLLIATHSKRKTFTDYRVL